jgi:hypothetical protein
MKSPASERDNTGQKFDKSPLTNQKLKSPLKRTIQGSNYDSNFSEGGNSQMRNAPGSRHLPQRPPMISQIKSLGTV